jgi:glycosyltransferase involved in cell wall biosynthesis
MPVLILRLLQIMMKRNIELTFGYSTLINRFKNISYPDSHENREVIVLVQNPKKESFNPVSPDKKIIELPNVGVAKSRNAALENAQGKYLIFADDDIIFDENGIKQLLEYFEAHPECAIIMANTSDETGALRKSYQAKAHRLTRFNSAKAATYEMMVRVDAIRAADVHFDENFGAGADNYLGDEYIFIADALKKGLNGMYLPIRVAIHPKDSSGSAWGSEKDLKARAAVFTRVFGISAPIFRTLFLLKSRKGKVGFTKALQFIFAR